MSKNEYFKLKKDADNFAWNVRHLNGYGCSLRKVSGGYEVTIGKKLQRKPTK
jgi:hypothetical protein